VLSNTKQLASGTNDDDASGGGRDRGGLWCGDDVICMSKLSCDGTLRGANINVD